VLVTTKVVLVYWLTPQARSTFVTIWVTSDAAAPRQNPKSRQTRTRRPKAKEGGVSEETPPRATDSENVNEGNTNR
jgi:hypothetical protein